MAHLKRIQEAQHFDMLSETVRKGHYDNTAQSVRNGKSHHQPASIRNIIGGLQPALFSSKRRRETGFFFESPKNAAAQSSRAMSYLGEGATIDDFLTGATSLNDALSRLTVLPAEANMQFDKSAPNPAAAAAASRAHQRRRGAERRNSGGGAPGAGARRRRRPRDQLYLNNVGGQRQHSFSPAASGSEESGEESWGKEASPGLTPKHPGPAPRGGGGGGGGGRGSPLPGPTGGQSRRDLRRRSEPLLPGAVPARGGGPAPPGAAAAAARPPPPRQQQPPPPSRWRRASAGGGADARIAPILESSLAADQEPSGEGSEDKAPVALIPKSFPKIPIQRSPPAKCGVSSVTFSVEPASTRRQPAEEESLRLHQSMNTHEFTQLASIQEQVQKLSESAVRSRGRHHWVISIDSNFHECWSFLLIACTLYMLAVVPMDIAFEIGSIGALATLTLVMDMVFIADIIVNFLTTYRDPNTKEEVADLKRISRNYLQGYFTADMLGSIPDIALTQIAVATGAKLTFIKLLRTMKIFRLLSANETLTAIEKKLRLPAIFRVVKISVSFFIIIHFMACTFWFISCDSYFDTPSFENVCTAAPLEGALTPYARSFHFSMAVLTANPISESISSLELFFESWCLLISIIINATIISSATSVLSSIDSLLHAKKRQVDALSEYMHRNKINPNLQKRIKMYIEYLWDIGQSQHNEQFIQGLPPKLKLELNLTLKQNLVSQCPLLRILPPRGVLYLVQNLVPVIVMPGEIISKQGDPATGMYFISRGTVDVVREETGLGNIYLVTLHEGSFFGDIEMVKGGAVPRWCSAVAAFFSELQMLSYQDFKALCNLFSEFGYLMKHLSYAEYFKLQRTLSSKKQKKVEQQEMVPIPEGVENEDDDEFLDHQKSISRRAFTFSSRNRGVSLSSRGRTLPGLSNSPASIHKNKSTSPSLKTAPKPLYPTEQSKSVVKRPVSFKGAAMGVISANRLQRGMQQNNYRVAATSARQRREGLGDTLHGISHSVASELVQSKRMESVGSVGNEWVTGPSSARPGTNSNHNSSSRIKL